MPAQGLWGQMAYFKSCREKNDENNCASLNNRLIKEEESQAMFKATVSFLVFFLLLLRKNWAPV